MPNAGKSTLLSCASAAQPKISDYPFTTRVPNLGVCDLVEESAGLVLCDIPGLVEGATQGVGLWAARSCATCGGARCFWPGRGL